MAWVRQVRRRRQRGLTRALLLVGCIALILTAPSAATAKQSVPTGNSEIDQYTETLPGASGDQPTKGAGGASDGASVLSQATERRLQQQGRVGRAVANLANATAPKGRAAATNGGGGGSPSGFDAVANTVSGSDGGGGGLGILLPLILGGVAAAALGYVLLRRRARLPS